MSIALLFGLIWALRGFWTYGKGARNSHNNGGSCWVVVLGPCQDFWHFTSYYFLALLGQFERYRKGARSHACVAHLHSIDVDEVRMA